jgi:hypothetical protein
MRMVTLIERSTTRSAQRRRVRVQTTLSAQESAILGKLRGSHGMTVAQALRFLVARSGAFGMGHPKGSPRSPV